MRTLIFLTIFFLSLFHRASTQCAQPIYIYSTGTGAYLTAMSGGGLATLSSSPTIHSLFCLINPGTGGTLIQTSDGTLTLQETTDSNGRLAIFLNPGAAHDIVFNVEQQADQLNYFFETNNLYLQTSTYNSLAQVFIDLASDLRQDWQLYYQNFLPISYTPIALVTGNGQQAYNLFYLFNRALGEYLVYPNSGGAPTLSIALPPQPNLCFLPDGDLISATGPILVLQTIGTSSALIFGGVPPANIVIQFASSKVDLINYVFTANKKTLQADWSGNILWATPTGDSREEWQAYDAGFTPITYLSFP